MRITVSERKRLMGLRAWHRRPPVWGKMFAKFAALVVLWCILIICFAVLAGGAGSPLMYYCLGLVTCLPIFAITLAMTSIRRWRINEAIINWDRVEELLSKADLPGE